MQKGHLLQFKCIGCSESIEFSVFELESDGHLLECSHCQKRFLFSDETLRRQIRKFENLCRTIKDSEEILSETAVGIDVGDRHVKIPYKLLLTRMSSSLDLKIGDQKVSIIFRIEPSKDVPVKTP
jgi:DNA-directed RNA polymerase subunit RPC12/RpoP